MITELESSDSEPPGLSLEDGSVVHVPYKFSAHGTLELFEGQVSEELDVRSAEEASMILQLVGDSPHRCLAIAYGRVIAAQKSKLRKSLAP